MRTSIAKQKGNPVLVECGIHTDTWRLPYDDIVRELNFMRTHNEDAWLESVRKICDADFWFFAWYVLDLPINHPYLMARAYETQDHCWENALWLEARDHWKALAYDTPVFTSKGWVKHGELKVGDYVYGSNGQPVKVVARTENFKNSKQYEITFDKKYKIVASCDHLWKVNRKKNHGYRESVIMTTDELFEHGCVMDKRLSVDIIPVDHKSKKLPINPYVLGVWLGDGSLAGGRIFGIDKQIFDEIKKEGYEVRDTSRDEAKSVIGLHTELKKIGVFKNKHIPDIYKYSSTSDRTELLKGLMDTDGTIDKRGTCTFVNINKRLCDDLYEVLISLGIKANYRTHYKKVNGMDYVFYNISFNVSKELIPFRLKRKSDRVYLEKQKHQRFITDIKPIQDGTHLTNCIQVDSDDGIYLAGKELIPTHNSTLKTFASTLWKFTQAPDRKVFLFSNSLKLAKPHFLLLKRTMETNELLKRLYHDVFYMNPEKDSPCWTINEGLFLKQNKLKDPSLSCHGVIDAMPTGGHPNERLFDDLVDLKNIGTFFMMEKVKESYQMADNLSSGETTTEQVIGTTYKTGDLYEYIKGLGLHYVSVKAAEVDELGAPKYGGIPVLLSKKTLDEKKVKQGTVYHAQMLLSPLGKGFATFDIAHLKFYNEPPAKLNYYIVADPASNPNIATYKKLDSTAMMLIGAGAGRRIYILDIICDKIGLKDKWEALKLWHTQYNILDCGYEEYATQKDREYFQEKMEEERFYFKITPLKGYDKTKEESISALAEYFAEGKIWLPKNLMRLTKDRGVVDMVTEFIEQEYKPYPNVSHDDRLDALRRFMNLNIIYPDGEPDSENKVKEVYKPSPLDDDDFGKECYWGDL